MFRIPTSRRAVAALAALLSPLGLALAAPSAGAVDPVVVIDDDVHEIFFDVADLGPVSSVVLIVDLAKIGEDEGSCGPPPASPQSETYQEEIVIELFAPDGTEVVVVDEEQLFSEDFTGRGVLEFTEAAFLWPLQWGTGLALSWESFSVLDGKATAGEWSVSISDVEERDPICLYGVTLILNDVDVSNPPAPSGGIDVCTKVGTDWRAPYADGTCPSGFALHSVGTEDGSGITVCTKVKTDWRAPYKDGTCPDGFDVVDLAPGRDLTACLQVKTDVRDPYKSGLCPSGFTATGVALARSPQP